MNAGPRRRFTVSGKIVSNSYCLTGKGFARQAKVSAEEGEAFLTKFFERYAGIDLFRREFWRLARMQGNQFTNLYGRPRRLPDLQSPNKWDRLRAERQAIGSLIQGTAAELTKESLVRIADWSRANGNPIRLVSTIHDEIQMDIRPQDLVEVTRVVGTMMEDYPEFQPVPIVVEGKYMTKNWSETQKLPR